MALSDKEKTLATVFYHPRTGFGSVENTFRSAVQQDPTISRDDVRAFMGKQELRQRRKPLKVNSFVGNFPRQEFQVDLMDMGERAVPRYGFAVVDIFSKKGACFPLTSKVAPKTAECLKKTFDELGYPASIMCDEGGEFHGEFAKECKEQDIELIYSRTGGRFVERFIRTLKKAIFERKLALGGVWTGFVSDVVDKYNDSVHSGTQQKPDYTAEHEYDFPVVLKAHEAQMKRAKFPVKHSNIAVGDHVKIRIKQNGFYKETFNSWSPEVYVVDRVEDHAGGTLYHVRGYRRPLLRFELKKVEDVHRVVNGALQFVLHQVTHQVPVVAPVVPDAVRVAPARRPVTRSMTAAPAYERPVTRSMTARGSRDR